MLTLPSDDLPDKVQDVQYLFNDLSDPQQSFNVRLSELQEQANSIVQQKEAKKFAKQTNRTIKDFERKVKRFQRKKLDVAELRTIIEEIKSLAEEMQDLANSSDFDGEIFFDLQSEFSEHQSDGWEAINVLDMQMNLSRWLKSVTREMKNNQRIVDDFKKQAKHGGIDAGTIAELDELFANMKGVVQQANEAYHAQGYEEAQGLQQDYYDFSQDFHEIVSSFYEVQSGPAGEVSREHVEQIASMLSQALQKLESAVQAGTISQEVAGSCRSIFEDAKSVVSEILQALEQEGDTSEPFQRLQALGEKLDPQCQGFVQ